MTIVLFPAREGNHHVHTASFAGPGSRRRPLDVVLCKMLAENEGREGDASAGGKGNTHLRMRVRSQRKDQRGHSRPEAAIAADSQVSTRNQRSSMTTIAASRSRPRATIRLATIRTTKDPVDPPQCLVREHIGIFGIVWHLASGGLIRGGSPMWTARHRGWYDRSALRYPSDLTDDEWALVEPLIPPARRGGNKRHVDEREVMNGLT